MSTEVPTIYCPVCAEQGMPDVPLLERTNRGNGSTFMGCSRYPVCTHTSEVPIWVEMRRAGATPLPGWE